MEIDILKIVALIVFFIGCMATGSFIMDFIFFIKDKLKGRKGKDSPNNEMKFNIFIERLEIGKIYDVIEYEYEFNPFQEPLVKSFCLLDMKADYVQLQRVRDGVYAEIESCQEAISDVILEIIAVIKGKSKI